MGRVIGAAPCPRHRSVNETVTAAPAPSQGRCTRAALSPLSLLRGHVADEQLVQGGHRLDDQAVLVGQVQHADEAQVHCRVGWVVVGGRVRRVGQGEPSGGRNRAAGCSCSMYAAKHSTVYAVDSGASCRQQPSSTEAVGQHLTGPRAGPLGCALALCATRPAAGRDTAGSEGIDHQCSLDARSPAPRCRAWHALA